MKITQKYEEKDLLKLNKAQFHQLWFHEALTDGQMAKLYNTTKEVVKNRRKELQLTWISAAMLSISGGKQYEDDRLAEKKQEKLQKKYEKQLAKENKARYGK